MIITDIKPQAKDPLRENIYLEGRFGFGVSAEIRFENKLKIGQEITETKIREIVLQDQVGRLYFAAQGYLSFRPRSIKEVRDKISKKLEKGDYADPEKILDQVIAHLMRQNLLNDEEFAAWWIGQRQQFKPRGERVLRAELHAKGIDREVIDSAFYQYETPEKEIEKVGRKKLTTYSKLPREEFRRKMSEYLLRRGYDWDEVRGVVDSFLQEKIE